MGNSSFVLGRLVTGIHEGNARGVEGRTEDASYTHLCKGLTLDVIGVGYIWFAEHA